MGGVDTQHAILPGSFETNPSVPAGPIQNVGRRVLPFPAGHVLLYRSTLPGIVTCNMTNCIQVNSCSAEDLTRATAVCRSQMEPITAFLRKYVPGFQNCYVISSASIIGVRETRHLKGEETLTGQDILSARIFDDWVVANAHFGFDVHNMTGSGLDATGVQKNFSQRTGYTIPYGCLVPLKIDNLLLAGRNISGTHLAHSSYRVMPVCANIGQAAGIAAALCAADGILPRRLNPGRIQKILMAQKHSEIISNPTSRIKTGLGKLCLPFSPLRQAAFPFSKEHSKERAPFLRRFPEPVRILIQENRKPHRLWLAKQKQPKSILRSASLCESSDRLFRTASEEGKTA